MSKEVVYRCNFCGCSQQFGDLWEICKTEEIHCCVKCSNVVGNAISTISMVMKHNPRKYNDGCNMNSLIEDMYELIIEGVE